MVIECCGYDQILDVLNQTRQVGPEYTNNVDFANIIFREYGNGKACIEVHDDSMKFSGWCNREYFEQYVKIIYSYEEIFGKPEEFGQMTLEEVLYV